MFEARVFLNQSLHFFLLYKKWHMPSTGKSHAFRFHRYYTSIKRLATSSSTILMVIITNQRDTNVTWHFVFYQTICQIHARTGQYVQVIQCFVLVLEYIRGSGALEYIFHNQHKTLYNLFSPDPAVSCLCDKQITHREIYTLCSILLHFC